MDGEKSNSRSPSGTEDGSGGTPRQTRCGGRMWRNLVLGLGLALIASLWLFYQPLRERIFAEAVLANDAPTLRAVQTMIQQARNPRSAILAAWNTGKIIQREVAIQELSRVVPDQQPLPAPLRDMLLAAALDPDSDVRESALNTLNDRHDPALPALLAAQLRDVDPQVRLVGLMLLKRFPAKIGVPLVMPMLKDSDPQLVAWALKLLENWSGENFGVKLADAVPVADPKTGLQVFRKESYDKTRAWAGRAEAWWAKHKLEFPPRKLRLPAEALAGLKPLPAEDFRLPGLDGQQVRLSAFRGKVVLINFWTTWCTACIGEIPELIALQKRDNHHVKILGISLDSASNDDIHGSLPAAQLVRLKVARTVASRGINYTVLLDEKDVVGSRFNGGELPTTVIIDAQGRIRRRFVGPRSLAVFEAMIAAASKPIRTNRTF